MERLGNTATLSLVWLTVGRAALSSQRGCSLPSSFAKLGTDIFGAPGLYVSLYGATGPTVLWLTGRVQGRSRVVLGTAAKIGLVMAATCGGLLLVGW